MGGSLWLPWLRAVKLRSRIITSDRSCGHLWASNLQSSAFEVKPSRPIVVEVGQRATLDLIFVPGG